MPGHLRSLGNHADLPIDRPLIVVGRHPLCDARLDSQRISRRHCCLAADGDCLLVRDLGSTNGTRINGQPIDIGLLHPGDELAIAHYRFRLEPGAPPPGRLGSGPAEPAGPEAVLETSLDNPARPAD
jgi:pSer/pThr/pTyr-binding forkhead associated (FHA) protein